jgi:hypothetical protein
VAVTADLSEYDLTDVFTGLQVADSSTAPRLHEPPEPASDLRRRTDVSLRSGRDHMARTHNLNRAREDTRAWTSKTLLPLPAKSAIPHVRVEYQPACGRTLDTTMEQS